MLKQLLITKKIEAKRAELEKLQAARAELDEKRKALNVREEELEAAAGEMTVETSEEDRAVVEAAVADFESEAAEADKAEAANAEAQVNLQNEIDGLQRELDDLNKKIEGDATPAEPAEEGGEERKVRSMNIFETMVTREDVKSYLTEVRDSIANKRAIANAGLTIPTVMLDLIREEIYKSSRLLGHVGLRHVGGKGRQNILGAIPEAVWTEMCANLNELTLSFNQVEVDGFKVGGYIAVCNALLEDSDVALASEIVSAIGTAIGKALDKAILFGTGSKMPVGIATRLATESQPAWWGTNDPAWEDLHTSNIRVINKATATGAEFFAALVAELAIAKDVYHQGGLFWVMNRKTHLDIMAKALAFNSNAALVANTELFPIVGGTIVEFEDDELADYEIIGGFGGNYLLAERAGIEFASSDIPLFLADQTVYKGTARYDGKPVAGKAFVIVNYHNTAATTTADFPEDEANSVQEIRLNTHTGAITGTGTLQLTAITAPGKGTVTWTSSNTGKATVGTDGLVTGVASGTATITATCNGKTDSCVVTVS